ncbi:hypothetical protein ES702_06813 [subsurface metagenome]
MIGSFEIHINRICWKKQTWSDQKWWASNTAIGSPGRFIYNEESAIANELRDAILHFMLSSQPIVNDLQLDLRVAVAVLMNTKEFVVEGDVEEANLKSVKYPITETDGLIEKYTDPASRSHFLKIVELLAATVCCVSGSGLSCSNWYPRRVIDDLEHDSRQFWKDRASDLFYVPNLDWAFAATAFVGNKQAFKAILSTFHTSDGNLHLSPQYAHRTALPHPFLQIYRHTEPMWVSALTVAIRKGDYELATLLLSNCPNLVNAYTLVPPHENALEIACQQGSMQMVDLILDPRWGLDYTSWHAYYAVQHAACCSCARNGTAACDERIAIIHTLLPLISSERDSRKLQNEVLRQACKWGCMTIVRTMVEELDAQPANFDGMALGCAAMQGHVEVMEYLLNHTAGHLSPLFPVYMVEFVEAGADRDMIAHLAERKSFILTYGALEPAKAQYLLTAAKAKNCPKVVELLRRGGVGD